jgi:predicted nucleic acid-binding protein
LVAVKRQLITTNLVWAELHRLLLYRAGFRPAFLPLEKAGQSPLVRIEFPGVSHHEAAKTWIRKLHKHFISYTDTISFATIEASTCIESLSFDHHFRIAGF